MIQNDENMMAMETFFSDGIRNVVAEDVASLFACWSSCTLDKNEKCVIVGWKEPQFIPF